MNEPKHTSGPWRADGSLVTYENGDGEICQCYGDNDFANANLIAAAPDMLAALKNYVTNDEKFMNDHKYSATDSSNFKSLLNVFNAAKAAVIKAEGRSNA